MAESLPNRLPLIGLYLRNYAANFFGNFIIALLNLFTPLAVFERWKAALFEDFWIALPFAILFVSLFVVLLQYLVQRPVSDVLQKIQSDVKPEPELQDQARRRLLNLPFIIAFVNISVWIVFTALLMPVIDSLIQMTVASVLYTYFRIVMIGLIASFISFFLIDDYCRRNLMPLFFPEGRLAAVPGAIRISILRRIRVLFGAGTNAPMILLLGTLAFAVWEIEDSAVSAFQFGKQILIFTVVLCLIFIVVALSLNFLAGKSILKPIEEMMRVVKKIRHGNFQQKVQVVSNDELGVLGDGMNEMADGLIERDRMRQSLNLAQEVQQTLLPQAAPSIDGLDIAATIVYCDETGGDYYDFLGPAGPHQNEFSVVVGDVSGHGIPSALLMASARAFLRQRCALPGSMAQIVSDVNRQLAADVEASSGFVALYSVVFDIANKRLSWVRAGHEPAFLYDPTSDTFEELRGDGMAMGVNANETYLEYEKADLRENQIFLLGTDGIWEARNPAGQMFGREPICQIIRKNPAASAKEILSSCFDALNHFLEDLAPEDDMTLVVIKVTQR